MKNSEKYTTPKERVNAFIKDNPPFFVVSQADILISFSEWLEKDDKQEKALHCPFCGKDEAYLQKDRLLTFFVHCNYCNARSPSYSKKEIATSSWSSIALASSTPSPE